MPRGSSLASRLQTLALQTSDLVRFYRNGAAQAPPQRNADRSHWYHRVVVIAHVVASLWVWALLLSCASWSAGFALAAVAGIVLGHKVVDPVNGLVHFALDNYFSRDTPLLGGVVGGFLQHHETPRAIARIQLARNVAPIMGLCLPPLALLIALGPARDIWGMVVLACLGTFFSESGFSLEPHKYAHMSPRSLPAAIRWLQQHGWLVPAKTHWRHHARRPGHEGDYASITGKSNRYLTPGVFRRLERTLYEATKAIRGVGIEPRSWGDPAVRRAAFARANTT